MIKLTVPSQLASFTGGRRRLELEAQTLGGLFRRLDDEAPMLRSQIFDASGSLRQFVGVFVNDAQVRPEVTSDAPLTPGSEVLIVFSVAGG